MLADLAQRLKFLLLLKWATRKTRCHPAIVGTGETPDDVEARYLACGVPVESVTIAVKHHIAAMAIERTGEWRIADVNSAVWAPHVVTSVRWQVVDVDAIQA